MHQSFEFQSLSLWAQPGLMLRVHFTPFLSQQVGNYQEITVFISLPDQGVSGTVILEQYDKHVYFCNHQKRI